MTDLPDGIYLDLPHDEYVRLPRIGSTGIADLLISPATFWDRSWMNPSRAPDDAGARDARSIGTAYHMARLEPERFLATYARGLDKADHPDALMTDTDVCAALRDLGETQRQKGEDALARAIRLDRLGFGGEIWSLLLERRSATYSDRSILPPDIYDAVETAMRRTRISPEIDRLLSGGAAEVSILWASEGVPMRCRLDYMRADGWADVKTFSNPRRKPVERCVLDAFRFDGHYRQVALYDQAFDLVRSGDLPVRDAEGKIVGSDLVEAAQSHGGPHRVDYIYCESNGSANVMARRIRTRAPARGVDAQAAGATPADYLMGASRLVSKGLAEIALALRAFRWGREVYGDGEPWGPMTPLGSIADDDYHDNWLDAEAV